MLKWLKIEEESNHEAVQYVPNSGWLPDLENLEIRPGGFENLEKQVFFSGKPWNESLLQRTFSALFYSHSMLAMTWYLCFSTDLIDN